jgi:hypothetical protein
MRHRSALLLSTLLAGLMPAHPRQPRRVSAPTRHASCRSQSRRSGARQPPTARQTRWPRTNAVIPPADSRPFWIPPAARRCSGSTSRGSWRRKADRYHEATVWLDVKNGGVLPPSPIRRQGNRAWAKPNSCLPTPPAGQEIASRCRALAVRSGTADQA